MAFDPGLLAYCGLYCTECSFKVAYETNDRAHVLAMPAHYDKRKQLPLDEYACECCKGDSICGPCRMRDCAREKGHVSCADCEAFPCPENIRFDEDDAPHHSAAVANLRRIQAVGYEQWFEEYQAETTCPCGTRASWYRPCPDCKP